MKQPKSKFANFLSFNQHRKRLGSTQVIADMNDDYQKMKKTIMEGESVEYTYGSDKDLKSHISNLKKEFIGQSELNYHHAKLIVLIRRGVDVNKHFSDFENLWKNEKNFLMKSLNVRWLISACDTFIDHSPDEQLKALLMNAVILINTVKLQESERFLLKTEASEVHKERKHALQNERLALFEGTSGFAVGTDDTLRNMRWRLDKLADQHSLGSIVVEVFERINQYNADTVYSRFRSWHTRNKTVWWKE